MSSSSVATDPSYFDYYNVCHHMALWLVGYNPGRFDLQACHVVIDLAEHLNIFYDKTDPFFVVDFVILDQAFRLFKKFIKTLDYGSVKLMEDKNTVRKLFDHFLSISDYITIILLKD